MPLHPPRWRPRRAGSATPASPALGLLEQHRQQGGRVGQGSGEAGRRQAAAAGGGNSKRFQGDPTRVPVSVNTAYHTDGARGVRRGVRHLREPLRAQAPPPHTCRERRQDGVYTESPASVIAGPGWRVWLGRERAVAQRQPVVAADAFPHGDTLPCSLQLDGSNERAAWQPRGGQFNIQRQLRGSERRVRGGTQIKGMVKVMES